MKEHMSAIAAHVVKIQALAQKGASSSSDISDRTINPLDSLMRRGGEQMNVVSMKKDFD
jgi:hypothetical protein